MFCTPISLLDCADWICCGSILCPDSGGDLDYASWSLQIVRDLPQNHGMLNFVLDCSRESEDLDCWTQFDTEFDKIKGLIWQANFVFGFRDLEKMIEFATNILEKKMPSIFEFATVRYSVRAQKKPDRDDGWYQASLHSEELTGTPFILLIFRTKLTDMQQVPQRRT